MSRVRDLLGLGNLDSLLKAARIEARAAEKNGYDVTAELINALADELMTLRSVHEVQDALAAADSAFDPLTAKTAKTSDQALALATACADGRRSWINVVRADDPDRRLEVTAVLDALEVVKWSALASALAQCDLVELQRDVAIAGAS